MAEARLRWLGHAFVEFTSSEGRVVIFDPWTRDEGNPSCPLDLADVERADLVLVSHDHWDHVGSVMALCQQTGTLLGGPVQTVRRLMAEGLDPKQVVNQGNGYMPGGGCDLGWAKVVATPALHSSDTGVALGSIVISGGHSVYHAGDTGIFGDMQLWGRLYPLDAALLPVGGVFTMDAYQAAEAARLISPGLVVPMHYASFPVIAQSADEFVARCQERCPGVRVAAPAPGEAVAL